MTRDDRFAELHAKGSLVIPNPWDAGSARVMADASGDAIDELLAKGAGDG